MAINPSTGNPYADLGASNFQPKNQSSTQTVSSPPSSNVTYNSGGGNNSNSITPTPSPEKVTIITQIDGAKAGETSIYQGTPGQQGSLIAQGFSSVPRSAVVQEVTRVGDNYQVKYLHPKAELVGGIANNFGGINNGENQISRPQLVAENSNNRNVSGDTSLFFGLTGNFVGSNNGINEINFFAPKQSSIQETAPHPSEPKFLGTYSNTINSASPSDIFSQAKAKSSELQFQSQFKTSGFERQGMMLEAVGINAVSSFSFPFFHLVEFIGQNIRFGESLVTHPAETTVEVANQALSEPASFIGSSVGNLAFGKYVDAPLLKEGVVQVQDLVVAQGKLKIPITELQSNPDVLSGKIRYPTSSGPNQAFSKFQTQGVRDIVYLQNPTAPPVSPPIKFVENPLVPLDLPSGNFYGGESPVGIYRGNAEAGTVTAIDTLGMKKAYQVSHASPNPIPVDETGVGKVAFVEEQFVRPESVGVYVAPHGETSITFLKLGKTPESSLDLSGWNGLFNQPAITEFVVSDVQRLPEGVVGGDWKGALDWQNVRAEPGVSYVTRNMELGKLETENFIPYISEGSNPLAPEGQMFKTIGETSYTQLPSNTPIGKLLGLNRNIPIVDVQVLNTEQLAELRLSSQVESSKPSSLVVSKSNLPVVSESVGAGSVNPSKVMSQVEFDNYLKSSSLTSSEKIPYFVSAPSISKSSSVSDVQGSSVVGYVSDVSILSSPKSSSNPVSSGSSYNFSSSGSILVPGSSSSVSSSEDVVSFGSSGGSSNFSLVNPISEPSGSSNVSNPVLPPFTPYKNPPSIPPPGLPPYVKPPVISGFKDKNKRKNRFVTKVRHRGQFVTEGVFDSVQKAFSKGFEGVKHTAGASFKVEEEGRGTLQLPTPPQLGGELYKSKKEKGVFIQPRGKRIGTLGEKEQITFKGIQANRERKGFRGGLRL